MQPCRTSWFCRYARRTVHLWWTCDISMAKLRNVSYNRVGRMEISTFILLLLCHNCVFLDAVLARIGISDPYSFPRELQILTIYSPDGSSKRIESMKQDMFLPRLTMFPSIVLKSFSKLPKSKHPCSRLEKVASKTYSETVQVDLPIEHSLLPLLNAFNRWEESMLWHSTRPRYSKPISVLMLTPPKYYRRRSLLGKHSTIEFHFLPF